VTVAARQIEGLAGADADTLDAWFEGRTFPVVEGTTVTFAYRGEAESVHLRHAVYGLASSQAFRRVPGTDVWVLSIELPRQSRMEYKLLVDQGGQRRLVRDPMNPLLAHDPYGANSVCHGDGYETPEWTFSDPEARPGAVHPLSFTSHAFGEEREVAVYLPARFRRARRYPLLVAHDGLDYLRFAGLKTVLDNLIHRHEVPPMIVACTQARDRTWEYAANPDHARFLVEDLLPLLEAEYPVERRPSARGLMGASLGAIASLSTAWRHPGSFGRLLLQSGSFAFTDVGRTERGELFEPVVSFVNAFRDDPGRPSERLFVSCGVFESLIYENRSIVPLLQSTGMEVRYVEARDGHNWENWRDRLREGLSWLFPGPLMFVYE
jgi:enterochelin esterase family protein